MTEAGISGAVYALGNFDGVHRGHQALIAAARDMAERLELPVLALSFMPHPRRFFAPALPPFLLTDTAQKEELLRQAGAEGVRVLPFGAALAAMPAEDFAREILHRQCRARAVAAGEDFRFGKGRGGDMARLRDWLAPHGIQVLAFPPVRDGQGQRYAASTARALLQAGQVKAAAHILGRPWAIRGVVAHGDARGRGIGFPTANFDLGDYLRPLYGVYAVRARRCHDGLTLRGVANLGLRPTMGGDREWLEAHFFDFTGDLYGQAWDVALMDFIRPERRFDGLEALKIAIGEDCDRAREMLRQYAYTTST